MEKTENNSVKVRTKASFSSEMNERERRNQEIAYQAACEAIVMLKNDGVLPLKSKKVAMFGRGIIETIKGGTGSGEVNERHSVSIFEGFKEALWEITNERQHLEYKEKYEQAQKDFVKRQRRKAYSNLFKIVDTLFEPFVAPDFGTITEETIAQNECDSCVYIISRQAGEGGDRKAEKGDLFVTDKEKEEIALLAKSYKNFVLLVNAGSQIDMSFVDEIEQDSKIGIGAILYICQLGTKGGNAVADVIGGKVCPSGKLSDTWAKRYGDIPFSDEYSYLNGNLKDEFYKEGIYVGYRYFDSFNVDVRYPFGFGLSYTNFEISDAKLRVEGEDSVIVSAKVKNVGTEFSGKEVVQCYVTCPDKIQKKEFQSLAGFAKTKEILPGKSDEVEIKFTLSDLASYDEKKAEFQLESGEYIIRLGNSSRNTKVVGIIELENETSTIMVSRHENICPVKKNFEELVPPERAELKLSEEKTPSDEIVRLKIRCDFGNKTFAYGKEDLDSKNLGECMDEQVQKILDKLSVRQMATICVGDSMTPKNPFFRLPGSVGNTTSKFVRLGVPNTTLCDGPAGIRIQKRSALTKSGKIKTVDSALGVFDILVPDFVKKFLNGNPEKDTLIYQFTTAFPVSNALAQTWNLELAEKIGKAVHDEMAEYGCTFWLAPALNIHRNPLCGRNFEYYSEDPLLSGKMAASVTKGVQCEEGFYVTLKHYCCNNQEDNRNNVSSNVKERALREIYLKGFRIAVEEGNAKSVMSAYNKVNGVYCANSYDLCTKVLRNEWGFDGIVMTDWLASFMGKASDSLCMSAGNDLIMPGGGFFRDRVMWGLFFGRIKKSDIRTCCSRMLKLILQSQIKKEFME